MTTLPKLTMPHDVFLLRHGETEWNKDHRVQGQKNSDLTKLGRAQACEQAKILRGIRPTLPEHTLWASPLRRAQDTAKLAFEGAGFATDARLSEINCGAWEGTTHTERLARDPDIVAGLQSEFDMYTSGPGGEGTHELATRLHAFLSELQGPAIIVSHKVAIVVMRALLTGDPDGLHCSLVPAQGSVLQISDNRAIMHQNPRVQSGSAANLTNIIV
ncbi:histidine phosphatase family protein [Aliiroseovarius sp. S2029]|uniref:histidine phosphatase family protein n=1 Tax=Aliiroseovarius sp. S2029 TaxID=2936988 RepID=UPI0020BE2D3D|nr:histidine phosphatase family protein [Aliiroseovarius sp. S2029]MCK8482591.1 histidine phosphatase family protein [Aliiroseovarius sp. S2029]